MAKEFTVEIERNGSKARFRTSAASEHEARQRAQAYLARRSSAAAERALSDGLSTFIDEDLEAARQINADLERLGADIQREHSAFREQRAALLADQ